MSGLTLKVSLVLFLVFTGLALRAEIQFPLATLRSAQAEIRNHQVVVRWQTASDLGVVYFDLFRYQPGSQQWLKINADVVVAANSLTGAAYELIDPTAAPFENYVYRLTQTDQLGNQAVIQPLALSAVANVEATAHVVMVPKVTVQLMRAMPTPMSIASLNDLDGTTFVKITTLNSGLQSVAAADLAIILNQPLESVKNAIAQGLFQLTTSGQPVTYLSESDADRLIFYAEAHKDNYSTNNIYWLTSQPNGLIGQQNGQAPVPTAAALWYPADQTFEKDAIYASSLPLGAEDDPWMWQQLVAGLTGFNTANYYFSADHLTQGNDRLAQLSLNLWGGVANTHTIQVTLNTINMLGQWSWNGVSQTNLVVSIPSSWLVSGINKLTLVAINSGGSPRSQWYLNKFNLSYPRTYTATNGLIDFTANGNSIVTVAGFSSTNITLLDVSNPKLPTLITNLTLDQSAATWRISFVPASPLAHCVAYQTGTAGPVSSLAVAQTAGLTSHTNAADYVIVSPPLLLAAATNLAAYRQTSGLKTIIAPLDQVYNEFAYGFPTPHAIQLLLATAGTNWTTSPRYLVLLGRGTYDFQDLLQQHDNLTPPMMVSTPYGVFASDSLMGAISTNHPPQVAVGRLSGLTTNDLFQLVNKIQSYERLAPSIMPQGLLIADAPDGAGNFTNDIILADAILTNKFTDTLLFRTAVPDAATLHSLILTQWNLGADFVNYSGHGAIGQFGTAGYLTTADMTNTLLTTCSRWPVVAAMTCVSGQYSIPANICLGESLLSSAVGGAIAFFGPTGLSLSGEASELNVRLTTAFRANARFGLGDMIRQSMADHISQDLPSVPAWIYNLQGDPALQYRVAHDLLPLQMTAITPTGLNWIGGLPPYQLEFTTNLLAAWQSFGPPLFGNDAAITNLGGMQFFRVRGSQ
jgi:hypothetical protein